MKSHAVEKPRVSTLSSLVALGCLVSCSALQSFAITKIMPLGDSITQGGINGGSSSFASYRYPLYYKFIAAGQPVDFVGTFTALHNGTPNSTLYPNYNTTFDKNHQADWGQKAAYLNNNLTTWLNALPANGKPDIAIINIGTNDAAQSTVVATFTSQVNGIISKLRVANPNVTIVLSNLMVIPSYQTNFTNLNNALAGIATAQNTAQSRVVLADIASGLPTGARYDGIHPNAVGEEHLATVYFNAIQSFIAPATANVTVDNAQSDDVTLIGSWNASTVAPGYYGTNYIHDNNTGKGTKAAMFMPTLPDGGDYLVYTRWIADANRATNVPVDIVTTAGTTTVTVNQQLNGGAWNLLGLHTLSAATAEVTFRNTGTNGYVFADVVRFIPGTGVTVDNTAATVTTVGAWSASTGTAGYLGSNYLHDSATGKGTKSVSFKPAVPSTGNYLVFARWPAEVNRATNVPVDIVTSSGATTTVTVNQQQNSNTWNLLGTYSLAAANAEVKFRTAGTTGYVVADGVRIVPAPVQ